MSEIDQQFIEFVVKSLVGKPDAVEVKRTIDEKGVLLELTVDPEDLGRVIGKRGATAQSLRTLLRALGTKNDARYNLKIVDNGPEKPAPADRPKTEAKPAEVSDVETDAEPEAVEEAVDEQTATDESDADDATPAEPESSDNDEDQASERLRKTREELADLDDLDV